MTTESTAPLSPNSNDNVVEYEPLSKERFAPPHPQPPIERRKRKSREHKRLERKVKLLNKILTFGGGLALLLLVVSWSSLQIAQQDLKEATRNTSELKAKIAQYEKEIEQLSSANAALLQKRLPSLRTFEIGKIYHRPSGPIESLIFTKTYSSQGVSYEYMAVLKNDQNFEIAPKAEIFLFNKDGIQISKSEITAIKPGEFDKVKLGPGESRSFSAKLLLEAGDTPEYFMVKTGHN